MGWLKFHEFKEPFPKEPDAFAEHLIFFLLAAAWVDPGRSALQSAEQWYKGRYGRMHQVGKLSFYDKNVQKPVETTHKTKRGVKQGTVHR